VVPIINSHVFVANFSIKKLLSFYHLWLFFSARNSWHHQNTGLVTIWGHQVHTDKSVDYNVIPVGISFYDANQNKGLKPYKNVTIQ
jgi:hypothetical protein